MPEPPFWHYSKIIKPMFDNQPVDQILTGRIITARGDEVIEDGFVEVAGGKIVRVGTRAEIGGTDGKTVTDTGGKTIMPGMVNSHAHLSWDGIHELFVPVDVRHAGNPRLQGGRQHAQIAAGGDHAGPRPRRAQRQSVHQAGGGAGHLSGAPPAGQWRVHHPDRRPYLLGLLEASGHEMRRAVRDQVKGGADLIKIMACHDTLE